MITELCTARTIEITDDFHIRFRLLMGTTQDVIENPLPPTNLKLEQDPAIFAAVEVIRNVQDEIYLIGFTQIMNAFNLNFSFLDTDVSIGLTDGICQDGNPTGWFSIQSMQAFGNFNMTEEYNVWNDLRQSEVDQALADYQGEGLPNNISFVLRDNPPLRCPLQNVLLGANYNGPFGNPGETVTIPNGIGTTIPTRARGHWGFTTTIAATRIVQDDLVTYRDTVVGGGETVPSPEGSAPAQTFISFPWDIDTDWQAHISNTVASVVLGDVTIDTVNTVLQNGVVCNRRQEVTL
jgi:hypothetical protein